MVNIPSGESPLSYLVYTLPPSVADLRSDDVLTRFLDYVAHKNLELYPAQEEAILELCAGKNVILATPTGSGKSLVATALHFDAMARHERSIYTAPIKALVNENSSPCARTSAQRTSACSPVTRQSIVTRPSSAVLPRSSETSGCGRERTAI
ncbi:MAG: DEAD/DEAH box helicase [Polyangiaceae bacterium]